MKKPTALDLAIGKWGFEDPRTIAIAYFEEDGEYKLARDLWRLCSEEGDEQSSFFDRPTPNAPGGILEFRHFAQKIEQKHFEICAKLFSRNS